MLREELGLTLVQAKKALVICLKGITLDDHQEGLARQIAEGSDGLLPCNDCGDFYPSEKLTFFSEFPKLKGERFCSKLCKLGREVGQHPRRGVSQRHDCDAGADVAEGRQEQGVLPGDLDDRS